MSLLLPSRMRGCSTPHPSLRVGSLRARTGILGAVGALTGASAWGTWNSSTDVAAATSVAVAVAAVASLTLAVVTGARSITRSTAVWDPGTTENADQSLAPAAPAFTVDTQDINETQATVEANEPFDVEPAWLRALRSRVHVLEATLEDQDASLARAQSQLDASNRREGDIARVHLTLQALRERASGNIEGQRMLDRVEAAVSRLFPPPGLQRPTLPAPVPGEEPTLVPPSPRVPPDSASAPSPMVVVAEPPAVTPPADPTIPAAEPPAAHANPSAALETPAAPLPAERVLPVPALPVQSVPRAGRWRRRGAV